MILSAKQEKAKVILVAVVSAFCLLMLLFALATLFAWRKELKSAQARMDSEISVNEQSHLAQREQLKGNQNPDLGSMPTMGDPPMQKANANEQGIRWSPDDTLLSDAFQRFTAAKRLEASIFLSVHLPQGTLPLEQRFEQIDEFYRREFGTVFQVEMERYQKANPNRVFEFESLPLWESLTFMENVRFELLKKWIPPEIVSIMIRAFIRTAKGELFQQEVSGRLLAPAGNFRYEYGKEPGQFFLSLFAQNPSLPKSLLLDELKRFMGEFKTSSERRWLLSMPASKEENQAMQQLFRNPSERCRPTLFADLPPILKWILKERLEKEFPQGKAGLEQAFSTTLEGELWLKMLSQPIPIAPYRFYQWLRRSPEVLKAMDQPQYDEALVQIKKRYLRLAGLPLPDAYEKDLSKALKLEKTLWEELVDRKLWEQARKNAVKRDSTGLISSVDHYAIAVRESIPGKSDKSPARELKIKLLQALVRANRGDDQRYIYVTVNMKANDLKQHLGLEEFKHE